MPARPRTRRAFSDDDLARLRALYDDRSIPLQQVADGFDVPVSTLLRWVAEMGWPRRSAWRGPPPGAPAGAGAQDAPPPPGRAPQLATTLSRVSQLARRELDALARHPARTLEERERVARLVDTLTRSLDRVGKSLAQEKQRLREARFDRRWRAEHAAREEA